MNKISILWGEDLLENGDVAETYCFATESELKAFMQAVHVMDGYFGCPYQIVNEGYIYTEDEDVERGDTMTNQTPNVFEHHTYNMTFALVAFAEGFAVYVCHPEDDDVRMWSTEEIEECEGHFFLITDHGMPVVNFLDQWEQ